MSIHDIEVVNMAYTESTSVVLTEGVWTAISTDDTSLFVNHLKGGSPIQVIYTMASAQPTVDVSDIPKNTETLKGDKRVFTGMSGANVIWALALNGDATLTCEPV